MKSSFSTCFLKPVALPPAGHQKDRRFSRSLTLMNEGAVDDPDGAVQSAAGGLGGGGAQRLQPVEQEDQHAHHGDGRGDARPHGEVEGREQGEDVDLFLGFAQQDADAVVQVALAEVHHVLPLRRDGDGRHRQVGFLERKRRSPFSPELPAVTSFNTERRTFQPKPHFLLFHAPNLQHKCFFSDVCEKQIPVALSGISSVLLKSAQ